MDQFLAWATAIGTLLAAIVPAALFLVERTDRKTAEVESRQVRERERTEAQHREKRQQEGAERQQAERVHFWTDLNRFVMVNTSPMPVTDLRLVAWTYYGHEGSEPRRLLYGWGILPPTGTEPREVDPIELGKLSPGLDPLEETFEGVIVEHDDQAITDFDLDEVRFTDAQGVRWVRHYSGKSATLARLDKNS